MSGLICFTLSLFVVAFVYRCFWVMHNKRAHSLLMEWVGLVKRYDNSIQEAFMSIPDTVKMRRHYQEANKLEASLHQKLTVISNLPYKRVLDESFSSAVPHYHETFRILKETKETLQDLLTKENVL